MMKPGIWALVSLLSGPWLLDYATPFTGTVVLPTTRESAVGILLASPHHLSLAGTLTVSARVDVLSGSPLFAYDTEPFNTCEAPATARPYFEKAGWTTKKPRRGENPDYYRWWANPSAIVLAEGTTTITVPLQSANWSSVYGERGDASVAATAGFWNALTGAGAVGLTFGGGCFFGHGVYTTGGVASFTLTAFTVG